MTRFKKIVKINKLNPRQDYGGKGSGAGCNLFWEMKQTPD